MKPFFSIIIPCCDVEPYVRECLDSVLKQDFQSWECLVGVETSKDRTEEVVRGYAARDGRIKVFTGERSGSCSASRNTGTDMATGEYVVFLDGDDTIAEGSLKRIHDKIAAKEGADLYPCAIVVHNELTGENREVRDNYPKDFHEELSGPAATLMLERLFARSFPCPMLQLTVFRREFLVEHGLKCIYGLRHQDSEFSPRALYLAKRVIPLHEPFYLYRIRENSVQTASKKAGRFHKDLAIRLKSLIDFNARVSREPGFDRRISKAWARRWTATIYRMWFAPASVAAVPEDVRKETLGIIFKDGTENFETLLKSVRLSGRIAGRWVVKSLASPAAAKKAERLFKTLYFPILSRL
jgi:glycosyltransferase involved in cell wall biosynthesis